jgi:hypothetical protein
MRRILPRSGVFTIAGCGSEHPSQPDTRRCEGARCEQTPTEVKSRPRTSIYPSLCAGTGRYPSSCCCRTSRKHIGIALQAALLRSETSSCAPLPVVVIDTSSTGAREATQVQLRRLTSPTPPPAFALAKHRDEGCRKQGGRGSRCASPQSFSRGHDREEGKCTQGAREPASTEVFNVTLTKP